MRDRSHLSKTTVSGAFYTIGRSMAGLLPAGILYIFIAQIFPTVQDLGLIQSLVSISLIAIIVAGLGLPNGAVRIISYYRGANREDTANKVSLLVFTLGIISAASVAGILFSLSRDLASILLHNEDLGYLIQLVSLDVLFGSIVVLCNSLLYSNYQFKYVAAISIINSSLRFVIPLIFIVLGLDIKAIVLGYTLADIISVILLCIVLVPQFRRELPAIEHIRSIFQSSLPLYGLALLHYLSWNLDYYLLLYLSNLHSVGIYAPAVLLANTLTVILIAAGETMLPYSSRLFGSSGIESLRNVLNFISRYIFLFFLPLGFMLVVNTEQIITMIFGSKYFDSILPAIVLCSIITLTSLIPILDSILMAAGLSRALLVGFSLAIPGQLLISILTIPLLGALAAAVARSVAYVIAFTYSVYRLKKLEIFYLDRSAFLHGIAGSSMMAITIFILNEYILGENFIAANTLIGIFTYLLFLKYSRALRDRDVDVIVNFSPTPTKRILAIILGAISK